MIKPPPKLPFPAPRPKVFAVKPRRFPKGKRVTIAAGFVCLDGIVLCADTQETVTGYTKNNRQKIKTSIDRGLGVAIVGSGDAELIETASQLIEDALFADYAPTEVRFPDDLRNIIQETFLKFFTTCIRPYSSYPRDDRPYLDLIIGIEVLNEVNNYECLFKAVGTTVREIQADGDCIGTGLILAKSLIERFYSPLMNLDELIIVACYIVYYVKKWTDGCGGNTDLLIGSYKNDFFGGIRSSDIKLLESVFERTDDRLKDILLWLPNSNMPQREFKELVRDVGEGLSRIRKEAFSAVDAQYGSDLFSVLKKLKTKPSASQIPEQAQ